MSRITNRMSKSNCMVSEAKIFHEAVLLNHSHVRVIHGSLCNYEV